MHAAPPCGKNKARTRRSGFRFVSFTFFFLLCQPFPHLVSRLAVCFSVISLGAFLVALTGTVATQDVQRLLAAGFDAVLGKPFSMANLKAVLSRQATSPQLAKLSSKPAPKDEPASYLLDGVGGDSKLASQMIRARIQRLLLH